MIFCMKIEEIVKIKFRKNFYFKGVITVRWKEKNKGIVIFNQHLHL